MTDKHEETAAPDDEAHTPLILTVAQSGQIESIVEASLALHEQFRNDADSLTVDALWNKECAERIRASVCRVLRTRASCSFEIDNADGTVKDFVFVPQGADRKSTL